MNEYDDALRSLADTTSPAVEAERLVVEMEMAARPSSEVVRLRRCADELSVLANSIDGGLDPLVA